MRDLALTQLRSGKSLTGEGGVFAPIIKEFLESALSAEMEGHLLPLDVPNRSIK
jgi:hypothetical protein